tara:strand:- start:270 stop:590 length:321 start_codon:yes stop_codon:yes gene_type:complete
MDNENKSIFTPKGFEIFNLKGRLFKNESNNPNAPAYKGLVNIEGIGYDLALWQDEKKGWLNLTFQQHDIEGNRQQYQYDGDKNVDKLEESVDKNKEKDEFNDDIPF